MKFFVLSGAVKNAGDFLIVERCKQLIKSVYPSSEIITYNRKKKMDINDIEEANNCDAIVYAGGPCVYKNLYPGIIPLTDDLNMLTTKIVTVGIGWDGTLANTEEVLNYKLNDTTKKLFERIQNDSGYVSCRDWYTCNVLKNNDVDKIKMTGCPAWYNLEYIDSELKESKEIKKIYVSDPADIVSYAEQTVQICKYLKECFKEAEIKFVFHRGSYVVDEYTSKKVAQKAGELKNRIEEMGIPCVDISYGYDGMKLYDECDLHIGYRVHAHIYNLSRRNISVLFEEDARGAGVNDALNIRHIRAYDNKIIMPKNGRILKVINNKHIVAELENWLERIEKNNGNDYKMTFNTMRESYKVMRAHIETFVS